MATCGNGYLKTSQGKDNKRLPQGRVCTAGGLQGDTREAGTQGPGLAQQHSGRDAQDNARNNYYKVLFQRRPSLHTQGGQGEIIAAQGAACTGRTNTLS